LKIPLEKNMFFGKKDPKKDNSLKCRINTLACYVLFGPNRSIFRQGLLKTDILAFETWD
jgi:hypothetical protein